MQISVEKLPNSEVRIDAEVPLEELSSYLDHAAQHLSETVNFPGFRPGKAPFDVVKAKMGEMSIWNEMIEDLVRHVYAKAIVENNLEPVGSPQVDLKKFAPGNPVIFSATVPVIPAVLKLPELTKISVTKKSVIVEKKDIDAAVKELQRMQTREVPVERPITKADKVTMNIAIEKDHVAVEGGTAKNHAVYLSEPYYIPGFAEQIVGLKKGESKTFSLPFPDTHFQKHLAGQLADFTVSISEVFELKPPALDDEFAKAIGQESIAKLRELIKTNMQAEAEQKEVQREEQEALEQLVAGSSFEDIPQTLINNEVEKMQHELEHGVTEQGLEFNKYLADIKKTREELKLDFVPNAIKRVKTILALRGLAKRENVTIDEGEVAREIAETMNHYKDDAETQSQIRSEEYANSVRTVMRNRKALELLREKAVK